MNNKNRIVIIEDDGHFAKILSDFLGVYGFNVTLADNGTNGIDIFQRERPDLLVIDVRLPDLSGIEVAARLRLKPEGKNVPIIMISAVYKNQEQIDNDMFLYKLDSFLIKPFPLPKLLSEIHRLLKIRIPLEEGVSPSEEGGGLDQAERDTFSTIHRITESFEKTFKDVSLAEKPLKEGVLKELSFPALLFEIFKEKIVGRLFVKKMGLWKEIFFRDGFPVGASSNSTEELLGSLLIKKGFITPEDHRKAMERVRGYEELRLGEYLLTSKMVTFDQLYSTLKEQIELRLLNIFLIDQGNYKLFGGDVYKGKYSIKLHPAPIIWKGVWERTDVNLIASHLIRFHEDIIRIKSDFSPIWELLPPEKLKFRNIRREIEGRVVSEILNITSYDIPEISRLLFIMDTLEMISFVKKGEIMGNGGEEGPFLQPITLQEVEETYSRFMDADYYTILGVERNIPVREVVDLVARRLEDFSPSNLPPTAPPSIYKKMAVIQKLTKEAGETLSDPDKRREYNLKLKEKEEEEDLVKYMKLESESIFLQGRNLLKEGKYEEAERFLLKAHELNPNSAFILAYLGWACYKNPEIRKPPGVDRGISYLQLALDIKHDFDVAHHFLGIIYKGRNNLEAARNHFFLAVKSNPQNKQAEEELKKVYIKLKLIKKKLLEEW